MYDYGFEFGITIDGIIITNYYYSRQPYTIATYSRYLPVPGTYKQGVVFLRFLQ